MSTSSKKIKFENTGYYLIGLLIVAILGFWPSYFSDFLDGTADCKLPTASSVYI